MDLTVERLSPQTWPALEDLFGDASSPNRCWCMWPRLGAGYKRRSAEENRCDLQQLANADPAPGVLAFDGDLCVGWCQVAPRIDLGWIERRREYGPVDDLPVWSIACFYIRRSHRGQGVTDALIEGALEYAAAEGVPALEAYPIDTDVPGHNRNIFMGRASTFGRHGFEVVLRPKPDRPVMRRALIAGRADHDSAERA